MIANMELSPIGLRSKLHWLICWLFRVRIRHFIRRRAWWRLLNVGDKIGPWLRNLIWF